jgi:Flp pilus assembly protein TadG
MLLFLGLVETGQAIRVSHKLTQAARAGARLYAVKDIPQDKVYAIIDKNMADAGFSGYTIAFQPSSRSFNHLEPVTVTVSMPVSEITWVGQSFVTGLTFRGSCTMPGDTAND